MPPDLVPPLQLAANLLALGAAAGFAAVVLLRVGARADDAADAHGPGPPGGIGDALLVGGSLALIAGHGVDGVLVPGRGELVGWLLAGGLVAIALGAFAGRLPGPRSGSAAPPAATGTLAGAPAMVMVPSLPPAAVGAAAGAAAAVRLAVAGRAALLVAVALALWGAARGMAVVDPAISAFCTIAGAVALGAWIWQVAASQLRAKLVVAFVTTLLALVVLLAVVLSARGAADLVAEEQVRLGTSAASLVDELTQERPTRAQADLGVLSGFGEKVAEWVEDDEEEEVDRLAEQIFTGQDLLAIVDRQAGGRVLLAGPDGLVDAELRAAIEQAPFIDELVAGAERAGGVLRAGDMLVSAGAVRVGAPGDAQDGRYGVVAGTVTDDAWADRVQERLQLGVALVVDGEPGPRAGIDALPAVLAELPAGPSRVQVTVDGETLLAAAEPVVDPGSGEQLGRVIVVRPGGAVAQLQRDQSRQLFVLALLGAAVGAVVAAFVAGRVLSPVRKLTAAAAAVGRGRLDTTAAVDSPDEIGTLGRTFDRMTGSLAAQSRQLREAADEQARLRARLEALTTSMGDGLVATDADGRVVTFNPAAARLTGREPDKVEGRTLDEVLEVATGGRATDALGDVDSTELVAARLVLAGPRGRGVPTDVTAAPVRDADGRIDGRVLVLRDVTREAELERMKTEFLSNVSHELRTPLTPIRGFADVLARRDVAEGDARRYACQILESAERMERVVGRIVDFAALDSGRMRARMADVDVGELVDGVLAEWRRRVPDRPFRRRLARTLPPLHTDASMLTRCLDELVDNAVKFSAPTAPIVVAGEVDGAGMVRLSVRDRGVGFEPERAPALFSEFYQVDASETRHFEGLGLGLALVRRIVDELGGDATVESAPGQGAVFHLRLPAAEPVRSG